MEGMHVVTPVNLIAAVLALIPYLAAAFFPRTVTGWTRALPEWARLACPALLCVPYVLVACGAGVFHWGWLALYAALPVAIAALLAQAARADPSQSKIEPPQSKAEPQPDQAPAQRGNWRDFLVLAVLGLAVDLRWFQPAWPARLDIFGKVLLLDAGIYGFLAIRQLDGVGFDLRLRLKDLGIGLREVILYTPIALALGLSLGFLHAHRTWHGFGSIAFAWFFTFFFIAVPEETFFRGWLQNLLERRMGRTPALFLTAALFGLSHFNKRAVHFNWRYVLLAAVAGIFYGRAWMRERRVGASAVTHATVDALWSLWLK